MRRLLLPHCTAFIPPESRGGASISAANFLGPSGSSLSLGHFFLQDEPGEPIFLLARQAPPNLPLCERVKAWHQMCGPFTRMYSLMRALADFLVESALPHYAPSVAQRIERRFPKPCVGGSSPSRAPGLPGHRLVPGLFPLVESPVSGFWSQYGHNASP